MRKQLGTLSQEMTLVDRVVLSQPRSTQTESRETDETAGSESRSRADVDANLELPDPIHINWHQGETFTERMRAHGPRVALIVKCT